MTRQICFGAAGGRRAASEASPDALSRAVDRRHITENLEALGLAVGAVASAITILQGLVATVAALHG
ncbi:MULTISPECIES: hypothetical protein [unclassified Streptomyces]|uniref:hypothetical protein n=1 Tax=unclassified Streptomyces TaxID=2593676 RepID=UPI00081F4BD9|nr:MULTISPECIES: hypothetical protein [unclassified Streptomyces]MYZ37130.1 hypothetical protein [Streptomyces sp. SID4917]SCF88961.1 hypothetical protein GA0115259_1042426 [Streptomyces sp. MnatMP-M17]